MAAASLSLSGISGWVGLGAGAMEQLVRPNTGKVVTETPIDLFSNFMQKKYGTAALFVNEAAELVKNNTMTQNLQNTINGYVDRIVKGKN